MSDPYSNGFATATEFTSGAPYDVEDPGALGLLFDLALNPHAAELLQNIPSGIEPGATTMIYGMPDRLLYDLGPVADK